MRGGATIRRTLADAFEGLAEVLPRQPPPESVATEFSRPRPLPREEVSTEARPRPSRPAAPALAPRTAVGTTIVATLRSRAGLQQALILSEILGPPKALRRPDDR